ncbi:MAG TPA: hypothetical protein VL974_08215, partial [Magnetospirillum sp.]|nr:hypothetical protein [Magnetospirillum sp.]
ETLADMFRAESLDAVIDAAGFVSPPTLAALGSRCAARQVLWRNAPYGAALPAVDALLSDEVLDAAPGAAPLHSTVTLRLGTALAQLPPSEEPLFTSSPREQVAFGADISLRQLSSETAAWWAELLCAVPHSTLVLRDRYFRHSKATDRLISMFGDFGVSHRVELISAETDADFWANADIGLMATRAVVPQRAVDVLWGGLPVLVPLLPERGSREVASLLHHVGLAELVADSPAGFAELGARWARDADARAQFHLSIRDRLSQSPVFDPEARAQDLWQALRQLFQ